jgi:cell division protein FtsB
MTTASREPAASRRARRIPRQEEAPLSPAGTRKVVQLALVFVTVVLLLNALVGERGFMETLRARRHHQELVESIERLRAENARLQEEAGRLTSDPATIEALARQELGLIRPGEMLFIIRDAGPAPAAGR